MARNMSDAEIRARKKYQATNSRVTGALGLTALGGTLLATKRGQAGVGRAFRAAKRPVPERLSSEKIKGATTPILATSAGLGGLGSFNFAAYTGAEGSKRGARQPVKKDVGLMEMGTYGEEVTAVTHEEIEKSAWEPVSRNYSPEGARANRAKGYEIGAYGAAGALTGQSVVRLGEGQLKRKAAAVARTKHKASKPLVAAARAKNVSAGKYAAGAAGAVAAGAGVRQWRKKEFGKSSAFGVVHD